MRKRAQGAMVAPAFDFAQGKPSQRDQRLRGMTLDPCCRTFVVAPRGEVRGNGHRTFWASGFRYPASGNLVTRLPVSGVRRVGNRRAIGHRAYGSSFPDPKARGPLLLSAGRRQVTSPWQRPSAVYCSLRFASEFRPIPVEPEFHAYGTAKLLPQVVPVKRETPYVVSPAMTG